MKRSILVYFVFTAVVSFADNLRPAQLPVDRLTWKDSRNKFFWKDRHEAKLGEIAANENKTFDFVLIGDSITHNWEQDSGRSYFGGIRKLGKGVAGEKFAGYRWLDLGIGGDGTQQVIWRLKEGLGNELEGYETRLVALMVGTNNRHDSAEDVALGIKTILDIIRDRQPKAKILLTPILPRFAREDDPGDMNAKNEKTNALIKKHCDGESVIWFDWRARLYTDGELDKGLWYDREHLAEGGYRIWADALLPYIRAAAYPAAFGAHVARFMIDERTGALASVASTDGRSVMTGFCNRYTLMARPGDADAMENDDIVVRRQINGKEISFYCTNPKLPGIEIVKRYTPAGNGVRRIMAFRNAGTEKRYITPFTEGHFTSSFQTNLYHLGAGYIGPYKPFPTVQAARPVNDFKQSSKGLVFVHPDGKRGNFSHFRTKIDDTVVLPWWHSTIGHYREYHDRLWYLPDGYRMGLGTFALEPGKFVSVTDRFDFFDGDLFTFFDEIFAKDRDIAAELASIPKPPPWIRDIYVNTHSDFDDYYLRWFVEMSDEGVILPINGWLYSWADYRFTNGFHTTRGGFATGPEVKAYIDFQKSFSPRIKPCIYNIVVSTSFFSEIYREHPEWFRAQDRAGNRDSLFPGLNLNWQTMFNYSECRNWLIDMLALEADDFDIDIIYLDEFQMTNTIDWQRDQVTTDADSVRFWQALNARLSKEGKMLFANGSGSPYADLNYMESPHEMAPARWRDWVGVALGIGMFNRMRPGQRACPLYWTVKCDYANRVLALGWIPSTYYNKSNLPIIRAVYQYGNLLPMNAKYVPDWKTDPTVDIESHSVKRDDADDVILSFINRASEPADVPVCVKLESLGYARDARINIWRLHLEPKLAGGSHEELHSDAELKRNWRERGIIRYARVTDPELVYSGSADGEFSYTIAKLGVNQMDQFLVTASPVALFAENDLPLSAFMTAQRHARISGRRVHAERSADILLADMKFDFADVTVNGQAATTRRIRLANGLVGTIIRLEKGEWELDWRNVPRKALSGEKVELPTPLAYEKTKVVGPQISYAPEVKSERAVDRKCGDVTVKRAAVYRSKCEASYRFQENLPFSTVGADETNLVLTAGTSRRDARVRTMETFAGFELEGARQLKVRLSHTFKEAHTLAFGHVAAWVPGSADENFTGLLVDYSVGGKYVKRVSMATGLYHPRYKIASPSWGAGRKPDERLDFGDWIDGDAVREFSVDLTKHAPEGWDGRAFVSLGTSRIECGRSLKLEFLGFNDAQATDFIEPTHNIDVRVMPEDLHSKPLKTRPKSLEKLDFNEWQSWAKATRFLKLGEGKVKQQTRAYLAHDYEYLYIGFDADEPGPVFSGKDVAWANDHVEAVLVRPDEILYQATVDVKGRKGLFLQRNPANAERILTTSEVLPGKGWRIFMALPIDDLKFDMQRTPVTIKIDFCRVSGEPAEASAWTPLKNDFFERGNYGTAILDFNWSAK